ncbi:MAG: hypothetical protein ACJ76V_09360 [Thermoleophilaceae bacterium]
MTGGNYEIAAVFSSGLHERLYSGLSLVVSTAAEGRRCAGLAAFGGLAMFMDSDLMRHAQEPDATPSLSWAGRETFARSLASLRDTALELDTLEVWACAASVETMGLSEADVQDRGLAGVLSTPRFLRDAGDATLLFV